MHSSPMRGMSLVDVIVGCALMLIMFLALFGVLRASLLLSTLAKEKASATALAETQMEYLRGISYDALGTVGGIPNGSVPQDATTTIDGVPFVVHTFISYVDDAADGTGTSDTNGITTDYKQAEVTVTYAAGARAANVQLVSFFAPVGIESTTGGGTLLIHTVDAVGNPVPLATVHIQNTAVTPAVDVTAYSNTLGQVMLPGAATSSEYQVYVSKTGYSSAQTYARDATNQNPSPGYFTVVKDTLTEGTFAIDLLSTLTLRTQSPITTGTFSDSFADESKLASLASTTVEDGTLSLASGDTSGSARSVATTTSRLVSWDEATASTASASGDTLRIHIYDGSGALLPESALPGNTTGFTTFPIDLSGISTSTYPTLAIGATFATTNPTGPSISKWTLSYTAGPWPLPGAAFTLTSAKTQGTKGGGIPIPKTIISGTTGSDGTQGAQLEWDTYALTTPGNTLVDACPSPPYALAPGTTTTATLTLVPSTPNSLRVLVTDNTGIAVSGATVTLGNGSGAVTAPSSSCGSAYFGSLSATTYPLSISKSGYTTTSTTVTVSGTTFETLSFP